MEKGRKSEGGRRIANSVDSRVGVAIQGLDGSALAGTDAHIGQSVRRRGNPGCGSIDMRAS